MLSTASVYVCFAGSFILFMSYMNGKDKVAHTSHNGASFVAVAVFLCCAIPAILWCGLFRHFYYRLCQDSAGSYAYNRARQEEILGDVDGPMIIEIV
jgi:hypothetical protein